MKKTVSIRSKNEKPLFFTKSAKGKLEGFDISGKSLGHGKSKMMNKVNKNIDTLKMKNEKTLKNDTFIKRL